MSGGSYSSASTYGSYVNGPMDSQYNRTFDQAGAYGNIQGNGLIGAQGQSVNNSVGAPNANQLNLIQSAGRRRMHGRTRRGGYLGEVLNQAVVPLALLGIQQTYGKRNHSRRR